MGMFSRYEGVAVCDLNGPFIPGDATFEVSRYLTRKEIFLATSAPFIEDFYKHCEQGKVTYSTFVETLLNNYDTQCRGKPVKKICNAIDECIKDDWIGIQPYAKDFLKRLKESGLYIVMLTSTPEEIASRLNDKLFNGMFDALVVAEHKFEKDVNRQVVYTTLDDPISSEKAKEKRFLEFAKANNQLDWRFILGVGDRTNDWGFYKYADMKMLLNPDRDAYQRAKKEQTEEVSKGKQTSWYIYPDPQEHLIAGFDKFSKGYAPEEKALETELLNKYGKINGKLTVHMLRRDRSNIIRVGDLICTYADAYGWNEDFEKHFNENFLKPLQALNPDKNNSKDEDPERLEFKRLTEDIAKKSQYIRTKTIPKQ